MKKFLVSIWEIVEVVFISLVTVFIIRTFIAQPFLVSGASMEPNFQNGNYLIIDEVTYRFREPERGEVIVFRYPKDPSTYFIKRVIGLPGDRVLVRGSEVWVYRDNKEIFHETGTVGGVDELMDEDEYFVLGDNRYNSFDSRNWGPVPKKDIIGLVRLRVFPLNELELVKTPAT